MMMIIIIIRINNNNNDTQNINKRFISIFNILIYFIILSFTIFFYTFSEHISVSTFNIDQLYFELSKNNDSHLLKEIVMAITKELVVHILSKENLDEQLSGQNKFLYSAFLFCCCCWLL